MNIILKIKKNLGRFQNLFIFLLALQILKYGQHYFLMDSNKLK